MMCRLAAFALFLPLAAAGQAGLEYAAGAARAAGSAGGANAAGKSIAGALQKLGDKAGEAGGASSSSSRSQTVTPTSSRSAMKTSAAKPAIAAAQPPQLAPVYEDPFGIEAGMETPVVLKRFGPPALQLSTGAEETMSYATKDGRTVDVSLRDGKVTAVRKSGEAPAPAAVKNNSPIN
jgi:hypothetical protein